MKTTVPTSFPLIVEHECDAVRYNWTAPPLHRGEIHVWRQKHDVASTVLEAFNKLLSDEERDRARRFRFDEGRNEYIASRGTLRVLLGAYQRTAADQLQFAYTEFGRPVLADASQYEPIEFNLSHSGGLTLLAFARHHRIGIDVEEVRTTFDPTEIAENYFSQAERRILRTLPPKLRHEAFFRCWTRKEAFIKALGDGLSHSLDAFDVSLSPGDPTALLATRPDAREAECWALRDIEVPEGYLAALAVKLELQTER